MGCLRILRRRADEIQASPNKSSDHDLNGHLSRAPQIRSAGPAKASRNTKHDASSLVRALTCISDCAACTGIDFDDINAGQLALSSQCVPN